MIIYPVIYIFLSLCSLFDFSKKKVEMLYIVIIALVVFIGFRGLSGADSVNYIRFFNDYTDTLFDWSGKDKQYTEYGFYYLSVVVKSVWSNIDFYFLIIAFVTMGLYLKTIKRWSIYPILSICVYYSRFMILREMNQIRGGLAISIVLFCLFYLVQGDRRKYIMGILIAMCFHVSTIIALPMVWVYNIRITFRRAVWIILAAGMLGGIIGFAVKTFLLTYGGIVALTYIDGASLGLTNPTVIFQIVICLAYTYMWRTMSKYQKGYSVIRNAYLYSIVTLLLTSGLGVIGGRLSTIFATCEIFIIPDLMMVIRPRILGYVLVSLLIGGLFFLNYMKLLDTAELWKYEINLI